MGLKLFLAHQMHFFLRQADVQPQKSLCILRPKKKRFVSQTFAKKAKCYAFFFFFFFRENSYANAIFFFFFFFFNQNIQLAYKKNNAIHSYFPFYHDNFSIFSSIFAVSSVQKKKDPSPGGLDSFMLYSLLERSVRVVHKFRCSAKDYLNCNTSCAFLFGWLASLYILHRIDRNYRESIT